MTWNGSPNATNDPDRAAVASLDRRTPRSSTQAFGAGGARRAADLGIGCASQTGDGRGTRSVVVAATLASALAVQVPRRSTRLTGSTSSCTDVRLSPFELSAVRNVWGLGSGSGPIARTVTPPSAGTGHGHVAGNRCLLRFESVALVIGPAQEVPATARARSWLSSASSRSMSGTCPSTRRSISRLAR